MIVGIDLGTTNSLISYYSEEGPKVIPNRLGKHLTPSVVSLDENGQVYVGETARERMALYPEWTASVFKRSMGSAKKYRLGDKEFLAEELSSFVLRSLKEDAESYLGEPVTEAVISVPAYFNDIKRRATKRAGELAGLKVDRIISEPTAAAVAYGLYQKNPNTKFLVFDLGGGTFDVSILELFDSILEVRAVAGDNFLGGEDFTEVLVQMFMKKNGLDEESLTKKEHTLIQNQAERCKIGFSKGRKSEMHCKIGGRQYDMTVDLSDYEKSCEMLLERIKKPVKRSLSDAHIRLSDIDEVVLVGGATKLSVVKKFVGRLFGRMPNCSVNPDEVVAVGAAIQGAMKARNEAVREVILTDVCPFTLGTEVVVEKAENQYESGHFLPIIERNTVIPASRTKRCYTVHENQRKILVNILQGESRFASNNVSLGTLEVDVPPQEAGKEAVDVTYTYDINAILEVMVKIVSTGEVKKMIIKNQDNMMTDEEIAARMEELGYLKIPPREQEANKFLLFKGERLYEESTGEEREAIEFYLRRFESALDTQDPEVISQARTEFKSFLDEYDDIF